MVRATSHLILLASSPHPGQRDMQNNGRLVRHEVPRHKLVCGTSPLCFYLRAPTGHQVDNPGAKLRLSVSVGEEGGRVRRFRAQMENSRHFRQQSGQVVLLRRLVSKRHS